MEAEAAAGGVAVVVGAALFVVAAAAFGATVFDAPAPYDTDTDAADDRPPGEYRPASVVAEPIPARGRVTVNRSLYARNASDRKLVVVDSASRVLQEDVRQLRLALVRAGHDVRTTDDLDDALREADAYVRIDPGVSLSAEEVDAVRNFTDRGGRVLLVAEPNHVEVSTGVFTTSLTVRRTAMVDLAAEYDIVFGNRYLYDTTTNDGNFRHVLARPTNAATAPDLDRVALYTATRVQARNATVLLRTPPTTHLSNAGAASQYPVAVRSGNVVALGDGTFIQEGRHAVADNEALVGYVAEFLVSGDARPPPEPAAEPPPENATATPEGTATTPAGNATETPTPTPGGPAPPTPGVDATATAERTRGQSSASGVGPTSAPASSVSTTDRFHVPRVNHAPAATAPTMLPSAIPYQMPVAPRPATNAR